MTQELNGHKISICMGSSCFSRGNKDNLKIIQSYLENSEQNAEIELVGCLCQNSCKSGPIISIDDQVFQNVEPITVVDILNDALKR